MKRMSLLSHALVIWGIFRSIVLSLPPLHLLPTLFCIKNIVCVGVCVWNEASDQSVFVPVIWAASKSLGCGALRCRGKGWWLGGVAHRKSTELNINPGCQERMALAMEDKEGHCFFFQMQGFIRWVVVVGRGSGGQFCSSFLQLECDK